MTSPTNPSELFSPFLPATYTIPEEPDRLDVFMVDTFTQISDVVNDKTIGTFVESSQNFNGEKWFYSNPKVTRNGYQVIIHLKSFPNAATVTIDANSTPEYPIKNVLPDFVITDLWGCVSKPNEPVGTGDYFSFMPQGDSRVSFTMTDTAITITSTVDLSAYSGFIVIQYLRNGS